MTNLLFSRYLVQVVSFDNTNIHTPRLPLKPFFSKIVLLNKYIFLHKKLIYNDFLYKKTYF